MQISNYIKSFLLIGVCSLVIQSCEKDNYYQVPLPHVSVATSTLEAQLVNCVNAPKTITSAFWKTADYLKVDVKDISTNYLYGDGLLNMTGIYGGKASFNGGTDPGLTIKAAYCDDNLYILAEWTDNDMNLSEASWLWNGPLDPKKTDSSGSWTSQRNSDKFALAFEIQSASGPAGTFSNVGCAASCHANGNNSVMHPDAGKVDIWNWSLSRSAPLGYLRDMVADGSNFSDDAGQAASIRNSSGSTNRSGPAYEWDGTNQTVTLPATGQNVLLDPSFYLLNKTLVTGDASSGDKNFHTDFSGSGSCAHCHGDNGEGATEQAINGISFNKKSRAGLIASMDNVADMVPYWSILNATQKNDIITYIKGFSGTPGYYLNTPTGSCADITSVNNISPTQVSNAMVPKSNVHGKYQVLIIRKLKTNNADDIQFDLSGNRTYKFGIALMNNDGRNHIGSLVETLTFK